jgi:chitosanase
MWKWFTDLFSPKQKTMTEFEEKRALITKIINCFEQGRPEFQHDKVDFLKDGVFPGSLTRQTQYTLSWGITQNSAMPSFLKDYVNLNAKFSEEFRPYLPKLSQQSLVKDGKFEALLKRAAREDKAYTDLMEDYFYKVYFSKAVSWWKDNGFKEYLSLAVIMDSQIHSGSMLLFLRKRFPEPTPIKGGNERRYIQQYLQARRDWLKNHSDSTLKKLWTRPQFYINELEKGNWDLAALPIYPNGVKVTS